MSSNTTPHPLVPSEIQIEKDIYDEVVEIGMRKAGPDDFFDIGLRVIMPELSESLTTTTENPE
jgi:hypothetical protein